MVDLALLQSVSYIAGALGVCVAASYYVLNLRETTRNRKATFSKTLPMQNLQGREWQKLSVEVLRMHWTDFDDFKRRYDSSVDLEGYCARAAIWNDFDGLGWQLRNGLIDVDSFTDSWAYGAVMFWRKFKPIIEGYRAWEFPRGYLRDFEYLAEVMEKRLMDEDPDFLKKLGNIFTVQVTRQ